MGSSTKALHMKGPVAAGKTSPPALPNILIRPHLIEKLAHWTTFRVTWFCAMAGSGKTTMAASFIKERGLPFVWYRIEHSDNDPAAFFGCLGAAVCSHPDCANRDLPLLIPESMSDMRAYTRMFFRSVCACRNHPFVIVLDDYQKVASQSPLHDMLKEGFLALGSHVHVIVMSRNDPPPEMTILKARRLLHTLSDGDLRFDQTETERFLALETGRSLDRRTVQTAYDYTQGWAAGLVLISGYCRQHLHGLSEPPSRIPEDIFNYFSHELFNQQPRTIRDFLLKTAYLTDITADNAGRLSGRQDAEEILAGLSRKHLFIHQVATAAFHYRYHALWRDFLQARGAAQFSKTDLMRLKGQTARILRAQGDTDAAVDLYAGMNNHAAVTTTICRHARTLTQEGRHRTLQKWIDRIPFKERNSNSWLLYWTAVADRFSSPQNAQRCFEAALKRFMRENNPAGALLAWSGIVDSIIYRWHDFTALDRWLRWLDNQFPKGLDGVTLPGRTRARVRVSRSTAFLIRKPHHPDTRRMVEKSVSAARHRTDPDLHLRATVWATTYFAWLGEFGRASVSLEMLHKTAEAFRQNAPIISLQWHWLDLSIRAVTMDRIDDVDREIEEHLETARENGLFFVVLALLFLNTFFALTRERMAEAKKNIHQMESLLDDTHYHGYSVFHHFTGWYRLLKGNHPKALAHARQATLVSEKSGYVLATLVCRIQLAFCLFQNGDYDPAQRQIRHAGIWARKTGSHIYQFMVHLVKAYFAYRQERPESGLRHLRAGLTIGRRYRFMNMIWWGHPDLWSTIAVNAIASGVEIDYTRTLVRVHRIRPPESHRHLEQWPWAFKVKAFGDFYLEKEGCPVAFNGRGPRTQLVLLKRIIAKTGDPRSGTDIATIADELWPDADGDNAASAFSTNLSRLRALLGNHEAIRVSMGRIYLNEELWWLDTLAFEHHIAAADQCVQSNRIKAAVTHYQRAIDLYRGPFLPSDQEAAWPIVPRERFRLRYLKTIIALGRCFEETDQPDKAITAYSRGLATDNLEETLYQRLMLCCLKFGRYAEVEKHYRTCRRVLKHTFGVPPSLETQNIRNKIPNS
jgi:LuxR family maltose regulon positive regulatory protein